MSFHVFPRIWGGRKLIGSWARLNRGGPTYPNGVMITFFFNSCPKDVAHWLEFLWELLKVVVCLALQCCSQPRWRVYWCFVCFHCSIAIRSNPDVIHICDLLHKNCSASHRCSWHIVLGSGPAAISRYTHCSKVPTLLDTLTRTWIPLFPMYPVAGRYPRTCFPCLGK